MVEKVLLKKMRGKLSEVMVLFERVYDEWYRKCEESVSGRNLTLYGYSKLLEEMQKRVIEFLQLMERLAKLEKEVGQLETIDEAVRALAYYIMEFDEEERKEVFEYLRRLRERKKVV